MELKNKDLKMEFTPNSQEGDNLELIISGYKLDPENGIIGVENFNATNHKSSELKQKLESLLDNSTDLHEKVRLSSWLFASPDPDLNIIGEREVREVVNKYKIDFDEAVKSWKQDTTLLAIGTSANLEKIIEIEEKVEEENKQRENKRENVTSFLQQECFISDFRRYPTEMLIRQYDEYFDQTLNYGVVIFPRADSTSAFGDYSPMLSDLDTQAKDLNCAVRIFECGTKSDLLRVLLKTKKNYSEKGGYKISFAILGAHGFNSGICLGDDTDPLKDPSKTILTSDASDPIMSRVGDFFEAEASVILSSCHTGVEGGIGQILSGNIGHRLKFMAPDQGSKTKKVTLRDYGGAIRADVEFYFANKRIYRDARPYNR